MFDFLEKLRTRPEHERRKIALSVALSVTAFILLAWLVAFLARLPELRRGDEGSNALPGASAFSTLKEGLSGVSDYYNETLRSIESLAPSSDGE